MLERLVAQAAEEFEGTLEHVSGFPNEAMKVVGLTKTAGGQWELATKGGRWLGPFDVVVGAFAQHVLTDPFLRSGGAPCAAMLRCLRRVESNQLVPMQVAFEGEPLPMPFTAAHVYGEEALSWLCDNCKKPQQDGSVGTPGAQHLTLLSSAGFAEREFNQDPRGYKRQAEQQMLAALGRVLGVRDVAAHRPRVNRLNHWEDGLAATTPPESRGCLFDADEALGWCGDFCVSPGLQGAALSGLAMSQTLAAFLEGPPRHFDRRGLLPADEPWVPIGAGEPGAALLDMGAFSGRLGLTPCWTHTDLVPSAVGGYGAGSAAQQPKGRSFYAGRGGSN